MRVSGLPWFDYHYADDLEPPETLTDIASIASIGKMPGVEENPFVLVEPADAARDIAVWPISRWL